MWSLFISNVKRDIKNPYFFICIVLIAVVCFIGRGIGFLGNNYYTHPLLIEEILKYSYDDFLSVVYSYNSKAVFDHILLYNVFLGTAFSAIPCVIRICDEKNFRSWNSILSRRSHSCYVVANVLSISVVSFVTMFLGLCLVLGLCHAIFPSLNKAVEMFGTMEGMSAFASSANGIWDSLLQCFFVSLVAAFGGMVSMLVSVITYNKFLSLVVPALIFQAWNEFCAGSNSAFVYHYRLQNLFAPSRYGYSVPEYIIYIGMLFFAVIACIYLISERRAKYGE